MASTSKDAFSQTIQNTEKQSQFAIKRTTSNSAIDSKESIQILTNINSIETDYTTNNIDNNNVLNEKIVSKVIDNIKQECNLDSFESAEEENGFDLENFLHGHEESSDNSITSSIFSNETELQDSNVKKCIPPYDVPTAGCENIAPNEYILGGTETQTGSKFFFHDGEPGTIPFKNLDNTDVSLENRGNNVYDKFTPKILSKPLDYLNDEDSLQANNLCVNNVVNFPSLVETNNSKSCDIMADYSQTNYNMVNFELLENLSESQMDNMELFNDQELNLSEISSNNKQVESTDCPIEFSEPLSPVLESEMVKTSELPKSKKKNTNIKKTTQHKCKKKTRLNTRKYVKLGTGSSGYTSHSKPISDNILNVKSVFNDDISEEIITTHTVQKTKRVNKQNCFIKILLT